ncbi:retrovirus-related pol polyprotein from transposon TNT 1-94 [Tanacetum coccineum]
MTSLAPQDIWSRDKHIELVNIIGDPGAGMLTRAMAKELSAASAHECIFLDFLFEEESKKTLVPTPYGKTNSGSKWIFRNKRDETGIVIKNKARLVAQGFDQQEGIDYDKTFDPVARLEVIKIFLDFATYMNFIVYQMDVKSAFLNGKIKEEVYIKQPLGFKSSEFPNHVCKLDKALYGVQMGQSPLWTLTNYQSMNKQFERGVLINQEKYVNDLLKKYDINGSLVKTLMVPLNNLGPDLNGKGVNETRYRDIKQILRNPTLLVVNRIFRLPKRDHILKGDIELHFIPTQYQLADIFTKLLDEPTFKRLIVELGMQNIDSKPEPLVRTEEN